MKLIGALALTAYFALLPSFAAVLIAGLAYGLGAALLIFGSFMLMTFGITWKLLGDID